MNQEHFKIYNDPDICDHHFPLVLTPHHLCSLSGKEPTWAALDAGFQLVWSGERVAGDWSVGWKVDVELWLSFPSRLQGARLAFTGFSSSWTVAFPPCSSSPERQTLCLCLVIWVQRLTFCYWQLLGPTLWDHTTLQASLRNLAFVWWQCDGSVTEIFSMPQN